MDLPGQQSQKVSNIVEEKQEVEVTQSERYQKDKKKNQNKMQNKSKNHYQANTSLQGISQINGVNHYMLNQLNAKDFLSQPLQKIKYTSDNFYEGVIEKIKKTCKNTTRGKDNIAEEIKTLREQMERSITEMTGEEKQEVNLKVSDILQKNKEIIDDINSSFNDNNFENIITDMQKQKTLLITFNAFAKSKIEQLEQEKVRLENSKKQQIEKLTNKINEVDTKLNNFIAKISILRKSKTYVQQKKQIQGERLLNLEAIQSKIQFKLSSFYLQERSPEAERQVIQPLINAKYRIYSVYQRYLEKREQDLVSEIEKAKQDCEKLKNQKDQLFCKELNKNLSYDQKLDILESINPYSMEYSKNNTLFTDLKQIRGEIFKVNKILEHLNNYFEYQSKYIKHLSEKKKKYELQISEIERKKQNKVLKINKCEEDIQSLNMKIASKLQSKKNRKNQLQNLKEILEKGNIKFTNKLQYIKQQIETIPNLIVPSSYLDNIQKVIESLGFLSDTQVTAQLKVKGKITTLEVLKNEVETQSTNITNESASARKVKQYQSTLEVLLSEIQLGYDLFETQMKSVTAFYNESYQFQQIQSIPKSIMN